MKATILASRRVSTARLQETSPNSAIVYTWCSDLQYFLFGLFGNGHRVIRLDVVSGRAAPRARTPCYNYSGYE